MKNVIKHIINIILVLVIIYCGYNIVAKIIDYKEADNVYDKVQSIYEENDSSSNVYDELITLNPDYVSWITIENTNVNYPVVQGDDNSFYLNKDINRNELPSGSIFMDYRNDKLLDRNTILYGHNMKNKTMFSALEKFKDEDFFNQNNKIIIEDKDNRFVYEVFSAYFVDANYDYLIVDFDNDEEYTNYIDDIKEKSLHSSNTNVTTLDRIITLSTCSYETDNTRTVVHGKLLYKESK